MKLSYIEHGVWIPVSDQRGEPPLLPFGNPIGFVPASRGRIYIESNNRIGPANKLNEGRTAVKPFTTLRQKVWCEMSQ